MVVKRRDKVKQEFSDRLNQLLGARPETRDERKRRAWLKKLCDVSIETARKWLTGLAIPDMTHLAVMVGEFRVDPGWLLSGEPIAAQSTMPDDHFYKKLTMIWKDLSDETKGQMLSFALVSAATLPVDTGKQLLPRMGP